MKKYLSSAVPVVLVCGVSYFSMLPANAQDPETPIPSATAASTPASAISVKINGEQIPFAGQGPIVRGTVILVPLRGIFEKLGAEVKYDAATKTITATKNSTTVVLHVGDVNATLNGAPQVLTSPPDLVGGVTMVPLRFVSEALGAQVKWDAPNQLVELTTDAVTADKLPTPSMKRSSVNGTVTGIFPEADAVTLRVASGENRRIPLAPGAFVQVKTDQKVVKEGSINTLRIGDQVVVLRNPNGEATVIVLSTDERRGLIKAKEPLANGNILVRLTNGTSVEVLGSAPVDQAGQEVSLADIKPAEEVVIRVNAETGIGISISGILPVDEDTTTLVASRKAEPPAVNSAPPVATTPPATAPVGETKAAPSVTEAKLVTKAEPTASENKQTTQTDQKPMIQSVTHDAGGKILKGGEMVTVTVVGTPKAEVSLSIPKLFNDTRLPIAEKDDTPGTYMGSFTVPFNITALDVPITATLKLGTDISPVVQADKTISVDGEGPEVSNTLPKDGGTIADLRPHITGDYKDLGTKVDPKTARLYINDEEVTAKAEFTATGFSYTPPEDFKEGPIKAAIAVRDTQGNETNHTWTFTIKLPVKPIQRVSVAPTGNPIRVNEILTVRMEGMPGGKATYHVETLDDLPLPEDTPGVYIAHYTVKKGDNVTKGRVLVTFTPPGSSDKILQEAPDTVTLRAVPPVAPVVAAPANNTSVKSPVIFSGTTDPYNSIRLSFSFEGKQFLSKAKGTFPSVEVKADENGNWKTDAISLDLPRGIGGVTYTVDVIAISVASEVSPVTTLKLKKK
jgi:hypothetical protein